MTKISQLSPIDDSLAVDDQFLIRDVSDGSTPNKSVTVSGITRALDLGTAAAPAIAFATDKNTGIFSPGADQIAISTNSTERVEFGTSEVVFNDGGANYDFRIEGDTNTSLFFVDASTDRVGLGTSLPQYLLHLGGGAVGAVNGQIALGSITNIPSARIDGFRFDGTFSGQLHLYTTNNIGTQVRAVTIDQSQRVGVGTTSPSSLLHLADAGDITVGTTTGTKIGTATTQKLGFWNATPVVQPAAVADATDAATVITQLNDLLAKLRTLGIIAT